MLSEAWREDCPPTPSPQPACLSPALPKRYFCSHLSEELWLQISTWLGAYRRYYPQPCIHEVLDAWFMKMKATGILSEVWQAAQRDLCFAATISKTNTHTHTNGPLWKLQTIPLKDFARRSMILNHSVWRTHLVGHHFTIKLPSFRPEFFYGH